MNDKTTDTTEKVDTTEDTFVRKMLESGMQTDFGDPGARNMLRAGRMVSELLGELWDVASKAIGPRTTAIVMVSSAISNAILAVPAARETILEDLIRVLRETAAMHNTSPEVLAEVRASVKMMRSIVDAPVGEEPESTQ